jgi:hypothetical protein
MNRMSGRLQRAEERFPRAFTRPFDDEEREVPDDLRVRLAAMLDEDVEKLRPWIGDEVTALR